MLEHSFHQDNKASAYFHPLTMDELSAPQNKQPMTSSMESDFDMSQSKLKYLGVDLSGLNMIEQSADKEFDEFKSRLNDFSRSVHSYSKKFSSNNQSTNLYSRPTQLNQESFQQEISQKMDNFKQKIQDLQVDLQSDGGRKSPTSDPYKISLHSAKEAKPEQKYDPLSSYQSKYQQASNYTSQQNYGSSGLSSGGLSFVPPQINSTQTKNQNFQSKSNQKHEIFSIQEELELRRRKYYDSFLPKNQQLSNCPLKLLKYKIQSRDKEALHRCFDDFSVLNAELDLAISKIY